MQDISKELIIKASEGDIDSFEEIYKAVSGFIYNVSYRVTQNVSDAEEITQEVFLTVHRKLREFKMESSIKTWLYRITVNTAINFIKRSARERERRTILTNEEMDAKENLVPAALGRDIDTEEEINVLLSSLNPDQRACIVLRNVEGLSYYEIAKTLRTNIGTVRSRLKRARETLLKVRNEVI